MDYFSLMIKKELFLAKLVNTLLSSITFFQIKNNKIVRDCLNFEKKSIMSTSATLILNAPSINKQNLLCFSDTDVIFVNRGFKHPLYKELRPKYHVFCDPKFRNGIWPLSWIDEIIEMVPDITFVMPIEWKNDPHIMQIKDKNVRICWIRLKDKPYTPFVAGYALQFLIEVGYKRINVTGWEANGLGYELIKDVSHFYGTNEENHVKGTKDYIMDFYMYMLSYSYYMKLSNEAKRNGIKIVNMTLGGRIDMFERDDLLNNKLIDNV